MEVAVGVRVGVKEGVARAVGDTVGVLEGVAPGESVGVGEGLGERLGNSPVTFQLSGLHEDVGGTMADQRRAPLVKSRSLTVMLDALPQFPRRGYRVTFTGGLGPGRLTWKNQSVLTESPLAAKVLMDPSTPVIQPPEYQPPLPTEQGWFRAMFVPLATKTMRSAKFMLFGVISTRPGEV